MQNLLLLQHINSSFHEFIYALHAIQLKNISFKSQPDLYWIKQFNGADSMILSIIKSQE